MAVRNMGLFDRDMPAASSFDPDVAMDGVFDQDLSSETYTPPPTPSGVAADRMTNRYLQEMR